MSPTHGAFVWYELMTSDVAAAKSFYADVNGWDLQEMPMPGMTYTIANAGGTAVAGLMALPDQVRDAGGRPGWIGYVAVDDVDAGAAAFARDGGMVHRAPDDIPGVGRFAVVADPQGAVLCLFKGSDPEPAAPQPLMTRPPGTPAGTSCWPSTMPPCSISTRASSAGPRTRPSTWVGWGSTSSSPMAAPRSAA